MTQEHPITPPPELVQQWWDGTHGAFYEFEAVATQAARWGADQELEACIGTILSYLGFEQPELFVEVLRAARRPKPPSLKKQALDALSLMLMFIPPGDQRQQGEAICRALEQLDG